MNEKQAEGFAQRMKGKVQARWGQITDDDYAKAEGNKAQLVGIIKEKTGEAEEAIREALDAYELED